MLKDKVQKLIDLMENTQIEEIEVSSFWGAQKIRLSKSKTNQNISIPDQSVNISTDNDTLLNNEPDSNNDNLEPHQQTPDISITGNINKEDNYEDETKFKIITAPLVGTFYSSSTPEDSPFINIGDNIESGMIVCIIEAMKIFNEIESEFSGELVEVYIKNGNPVEYGQELFVLRINNV